MPQKEGDIFTVELRRRRQVKQTAKFHKHLSIMLKKRKGRPPKLSQVIKEKYSKVVPKVDPAVFETKQQAILQEYEQRLAAAPKNERFTCWVEVVNHMKDTKQATNGALSKRSTGVDDEEGDDSKLEKDEGAYDSDAVNDDGEESPSKCKSKKPYLLK